MPRTIWKGAISFGLVHVPVGVLPASQSIGIDFDWLDRRSMDPVGYKRVNKRTGKEITKDDIVRGIRQEGGEYVVLSDEDIRAAYPRSTQTIDIETFVSASDITPPLLDTPYYLVPQARSQKVYALLREALRESGMVGIARLVMHTKEHLAMLMPGGAALVLNTLRWPEEMRDVGDVDFPPMSRSAAGVKDKELEMAVALIEQMSGSWQPRDFKGRFESAIHELVKHKLAAGDTKEVTPLEEAPETSRNVVDLTALLRQSLGQRGDAGKGKGKGKGEPKTAARKRA